MAMAVVYTNFAGQIVSENRGGTVREYVPDTLGSTTALATSASITDTWDYWPYGEVMTRTGSTPTPFTFVGVLGYFKDLLDRLFYVRARHYQPNYGRWLTVDPLWSDVRLQEGLEGDPPYSYSLNNPVSFADRSGMQTIDDLIAALPKNLGSMWSQPPFVRTNNCYFYGCDNMLPGGPPRQWPNPGGWDCMFCTNDATSDSCKCKKLMECIAKDRFMQPRAKGQKCPPGTFTVIAFVKPTPPCDYHFVRSLPNGQWCDKHGEFPVCNPFDNPYEHSRNLGYTVVCQHYCVRSKQ